MSVPIDSTQVMEIAKTAFAAWTESAKNSGGNELLILTLGILFVLWVAMSEWKARRMEKREDEREKLSRSREDSIRTEENARQEKDNESKKAFAAEIKGLINDVSGKLETLNDTFKNELHLLDKRLSMNELKAEDNHKRLTALEIKKLKEQ